MDLDTELNLAQAATQLGTSVGKLIKYGAHGKLTISVVANDWPIRTDNETAETISGLVALVPDDLLQSYGADFTLVRNVVTLDAGETVFLLEPIKLLRGVLFVTAEEYRRFRRKLGNAATQGEDVPLYLDSNHEWHSSQLAVAIEAWTALFSSGDFDPKGKSAKFRILQWLAKNAGDLKPNARANIATCVNPDKGKGGGNPSTPIKSTSGH
jgi:hypothetical protein